MRGAKMSLTSYKKVLEESHKMLCKIVTGKKSDDDATVVQLYEIMAQCLNEVIHRELMTIHSDKDEKEIRLLLSRYVLGFKDKRGVIWLGAIKPLETRIQALMRKRNVDTSVLKRYMEVYDDFMALASFRSFKHFCLYMESDWDKKIWLPTLNIFEGWYYYANKMVLDGDVKFIEKQLPVAYGKSVSDNFLIAWIFGHDIDSDVIKVFGNRYNCERAFNTIIELMCNEKYAKVFPYYKQFGGRKDNIFEICKASDGTFKITGTKKPTNFLCVGKESKISGVRTKYFFLDDITQAEDAGKISAHDKDINTYQTVWSKRFYSSENSHLIVGGTTYSQFDILTYLKKKFNIEESVQSRVNKYTRVATSNVFGKGGISAFICVPKLDYDTDESTYPTEFPTENARKDREENYLSFMAMEQQQPLAPQDCPFFMDNLKEYTQLPEIGGKDRDIYHLAYLDTKRKGNDFCAMAIGFKYGNMFAMNDCLYDQRPMQDIYPSIVAKIIKHNISQLFVEVNINEGIVDLLTRMLAERGYYNCKITEVFNYEKKDDRIAGEEANIKSFMMFPKFGMYPRSSEFGQAMEELYGYSYRRKNEHDDFTDACAGFSRAFINSNRSSNVKISSFSR